MPYILKTDNTRQEFDPRKLANSLSHAGAEPEAIHAIVEEVSREVRDGMTTHEIYSRAFALLRQKKGRSAAHYSLKRAVLEFGPSGFPFESYLAEIFRAQGYEAEVDQHIRGRCVEHEVDVVLSKGSEKTYVEAKFHNSIGFKTDLQVVLYVQARVEDIIARGGHEGLTVRGMLATNTKFTDVVRQYAECRGLSLLSWEYPEKGNLHDLIAQTGLYPITVLTSLGHNAKESLLADRVVLCRDVVTRPDSLAKAGITSHKSSAVLEEAKGLCNI